MVQDANIESEKILAEARDRANEIRQRAAAQAEAERKSILERAHQEIERQRAQAVATAQLKARNDQLAHREELLERVFVTAREKIPAIRQWSNYDQIAVALLKEALLHMKDYPVQVLLDPETRKVLPEQKLEQIASDLRVQVTGVGELEAGTGVIVETADGHLNYDNTLETRLSRLQNSLRAPVYHILMGEQV